MKALAAACTAGAVLLVLQCQWRRRWKRPLAQKSDLRTLRDRPEEMPARLRTHFYFDFDAAARRGCEHVAYLRSASDVSSALDGLHSYLVEGLLRQLETSEGRLEHGLEHAPEIACGKPASFRPEHVLSSATGCEPPPRLLVGEGAAIHGGTFDLTEGSIYIGAEGECSESKKLPISRQGIIISPATLLRLSLLLLAATVEHGAYLRGPAYISRGCVVRHGAYIRGDVALGAGCVVGGELKHMLALDECELPHYGCAQLRPLRNLAPLYLETPLSLFPFFSFLFSPRHAHPRRRRRLSPRLPGALWLRFRHRQLPAFPHQPPRRRGHTWAHVLARAAQVWRGGGRPLAARMRDGDRARVRRQSFRRLPSPSIALHSPVFAFRCLMAPHTVCYPNSRLARGAYGPRELLKNRPQIERAPLRVGN